MGRTPSSLPLLLLGAAAEKLGSAAAAGSDQGNGVPHEIQSVFKGLK